MGEKPRSQEDDELTPEELAQMHTEQEKRENDYIEQKFGAETLDITKQLGNDAKDTVKLHVSEAENIKEVEEALSAWREFILRAQERCLPGNIKDLKMVETMLKTAAAALAPEIGEKEKADMREGINLMERRSQ